MRAIDKAMRQRSVLKGFSSEGCRALVWQICDFADRRFFNFSIGRLPSRENLPMAVAVIEHGPPREVR
jgi:hypothetical protein